MKKENRKMQKVSFKNVGEFMGYLPEDQLEIVDRLRELVFECIDGVEEKLSYNVPFYRKHRVICYLWAGAVAWGKKTYEGVEFGFQNGNLLDDPHGYLERGKRKQVFFKRFLRVEDIDEDMMRSFLIEANEIDEMLYREKMMKRRSK